MRLTSDIRCGILHDRTVWSIMGHRSTIPAILAVILFAGPSFSAGSDARGVSSGQLVQAAEPTASYRSRPRVRPRIEVYPERGYHRECVGGFREVWRPYWGGNVIMPFERCWWVRG
jgi:hypothetical protein